MDFIGVLFLIGVVWIVGRWIVSIANSIEESNRKRKRQEHINHLRSMSSQYPDAYKEWYGSSYGLTSLSDSELETRAGKSIYSWQTKQREIEAARERKRKEEERKKERSKKASALCSKYPNAVQEIVGTRFLLSDSQVDQLLGYSETYIKNKENQIVAEQQRIKAEKEEQERKRKEEIENKYKLLYKKYPNGVELVKLLRDRREECQEVYTRVEFARIKRGGSVSNDSAHIVSIPESVYEKYEPIAVKYSTLIDWENQQVEISAKARRLVDAPFTSWGAYCYYIDVNGIDLLGEPKVYESKVWQLFMEAYGISDNVPYTHYSNLLENRGRLPEFKRGTRTFTNWVYDQVVDIIEKLSDKASVIICDSQLGSVWNNIEAKHFTYLYQKLQEKQITHINLSDLNASKQLVGKTIVVIELISNNSHLKDICSQIYSTVENATIVYISLNDYSMLYLN